jgi:hypothetical protein
MMPTKISSARIRLLIVWLSTPVMVLMTVAGSIWGRRMVAASIPKRASQP